MQNFKVILPSVILAPYVQRYWVLKIDSLNTYQRIIPNCCIELMFNRGDKIKFLSDDTFQPTSYIKGQNANYYDLVLNGSVNIISISFTSFGAKAFLSMPIDVFTDRCTDASDLGDQLLIDLSKRVADNMNDEACISLIEEFLLKRLNPLKDYNQERLLSAINLMTNYKESSIMALADRACISYRQFIRIFTEHIGMNPKEYLRIIRFQRALFIMQKQPKISPVELAFECGYYDQSHLINEFKSFSGYTFSEYSSFCTPHSDYFA